MRPCERAPGAGTLGAPLDASSPPATESEESALSPSPSGYTPEQDRRLRAIHARLVEARRELDALIGDAYLRPRASIVPVHFLDLASAVEKLRWAEKEWRELDREIAARGAAAPPAEGGGTASRSGGDDLSVAADDDEEDAPSHGFAEATGARRS